MRARVITASLVATGAAASLAIAAPAASAAPGVVRNIPHVVATAAGSTINDQNDPIHSGPTASSSVNTLRPDVTSVNSLVNAGSTGLLSSGPLVTRAASSAIPDGLASLGHARTTGVKLLGGLIQATAVDTTATATITSSGHATTSVNTTISGLRISGLPIRTPDTPNQEINIPGVVSITLNAGHASTSRVGASTTGAGVVITLLSALNGAGAGTTISISPVSASADVVGKGYAPVSGYAYASKIRGSVADVLKLGLNKSALISMPLNGTRGQDLTNDTAGLAVPGVANLGAVTSTANGLLSQTDSHSTLSTHIGTLNLLGGLITADGISAKAEVTQDADGNRTSSGSTDLANLTIAGTPVPAEVAPNTQYKLPGIGLVQLNQQILTGDKAIVRALIVRITSATTDLPVGAVIEFGTAVASFRP